MELEKLHSIIDHGENIHTEFKRCGNGIEKDVYETVCAFANRFGGDILCGVLDSGEIRGLPKKAVPSLIKNMVQSLFLCD